MTRLSPQLPAEQVAQRPEATAVAPAAGLPDPELGRGVVDPATAVSALLPEERGGTGPAPAPLVAPPVRPAPIRTPAIVTSVLAAAGAIVAAGFAGVSARLGRRAWVLRGGQSVAPPLAAVGQVVSEKGVASDV